MNISMQLKTLLILSLLLLSINIYAANKIIISANSCAGIDKKIENLNSNLRMGYSVKKGEALKKKLRKLKQQQYACKMKRFATK